MFSTTPSSVAPDPPKGGRHTKIYQKWLELIADQYMNIMVLPSDLECVRQKYRMADPDYDVYWKAVASVKAAKTKNKITTKWRAAELKLRSIETKQAEEGRAPQERPLPSHKHLMTECNTREGEGLGSPNYQAFEALLEKVRSSIKELSLQVDYNPWGRGLIVLDIDKRERKKKESKRLVEILGIDGYRLIRLEQFLDFVEDGSPTGRRRTTKSLLNEKKAALQDSINQVEVSNPHSNSPLQSIPVLIKGGRVQYMDRNNKRPRRDTGIPYELDEDKIRYYATDVESRVDPDDGEKKHSEPRSSDVSDILDEAVEQNKKTEGTLVRRIAVADKVGPQSSDGAIETDIETDFRTRNRLFRHIYRPDNGHQMPPEVVSGRFLGEIQENPARPVSLEPRLSDSLRLQVPLSGQILIDAKLTVDLNADVTELQAQIVKMQDRLKISFPRVDAMPYDVSKSENPKALQTWLKILVYRWKTRFELEGSSDKQLTSELIRDYTKSVLDEMVRDHDLSNEAAERMANRWNKISSSRSDLNTDSQLDREAIDAAGLSFLTDDDTSKQQRRSSEEERWPLIRRTNIPPSQKKFGPSILDPLIRRQCYSTSSSSVQTRTAASMASEDGSASISLPHLTPSGSAHMVSVSAKKHTTRTAIAVGTVFFSKPSTLRSIREASLNKGDVLSVSRIAGIMAAKKCPDLIPLCHPIPLTHVAVELYLLDSSQDSPFGGVHIEAKVECTGPTGVEMEALTAVMGAGLSVVDMCKAVDRFQRIGDVRVVLKEGGRSGTWKEEGWRSLLV